MTPNEPIPNQPRLVRPWVGTWAWVTVILSFILIALGGFVTSFRVGLADRVWPTEPWFLFNNRNWDFGFVVEHTHRFVGWIVGLAVTLLTFAVWRSEPNRKLRRLGFVALIGLLLSYGEFHRGFRGTFDQIKTLGQSELNIDAKTAGVDVILNQSRLLAKVEWPWLAIIITLAFAGFALYCGIRSYFTRQPGGIVRMLAVISLIAVMIQGLLGGFRVLLNALMGTNLAAIHGAFGQIAVCVLIAVAVLTVPRRFGDSIPSEERKPLAKLGWILVGVLLIQLLWAVMLRHTGSGISQRLHLLTAFVASGLVVWLCVRIFTSVNGRFVFSVHAWILLGLLGTQLLFGVEAYLGKFAAMGRQAQWLPETRTVTTLQASIRTVHQLIGCGLLAVAVALAIRLGRTSAVQSQQIFNREGAIPDMAVMAMMLSDNTPGREGAIPDVAALALVPLDDDVLTTRNVPDVAAMVMNPPAGGLLR